MSEPRAGRKLDVLIAERVMGWTKPPRGSQKDILTGRLPVWRELPFEYVDTPAFSTDIAAGWMVVDKMADRGFGVAIATTPIGYRAEFVTGCGESGETLPLAICLAALKAVGAT